MYDKKEESFEGFQTPEAKNNYRMLKEKYNNKSVISKKELADELGVSTSKIDTIIANKEIKFKKLGDKKISPVRFNLIDVAEYITGK
jgi:DNA-binding Xre family transcriptional regulator